MEANEICDEIPQKLQRAALGLVKSFTENYTGWLATLALLSSQARKNYL